MRHRTMPTKWEKKQVICVFSSLLLTFIQLRLEKKGKVTGKRGMSSAHIEVHDLHFDVCFERHDPEFTVF